MTASPIVPLSEDVEPLPDLSKMVETMAVKRFENEMDLAWQSLRAALDLSRMAHYGLRGRDDVTDAMRRDWAGKAAEFAQIAAETLAVAGSLLMPPWPDEDPFGSDNHDEVEDL